MTSRGFYTLLFGVLMLFTALSVSSAGAFLLGAAALTCWLLALLSVLLGALTCKVSQSVGGGQTSRGSSCPYHLSLRMPIPAPIAPLSLKVCLPSGTAERFFACRQSFRLDRERQHLSLSPRRRLSGRHHANHVFRLLRSVFPAQKSPLPLVFVTVLPNPIETEPLAVSPGEGESLDHPARACRPQRAGGHPRLAGRRRTQARPLEALHAPSVADGAYL